MLEEAVAALALTGATTLVASMATDAWQAARSGTERLFRRAGQERQAIVRAQLDSHAALVDRAAATDRARQSLLGSWQLELEQFLEEYPDAVEELRILLTQVGHLMSPSQQQWVQYISADNGGHAYGAQGPGSAVHIHDRSAAAPAPVAAYEEAGPDTPASGHDNSGQPL